MEEGSAGRDSWRPSQLGFHREASGNFFSTLITIFVVKREVTTTRSVCHTSFGYLLSRLSQHRIDAAVGREWTD